MLNVNSIDDGGLKMVRALLVLPAAVIVEFTGPSYLTEFQSLRYYSYEGFPKL